MKSVRTLAGSAPRLRPTPCAQPGARQSSQGEKKEQVKVLLKEDLTGFPDTQDGINKRFLVMRAF